MVIKNRQPRTRARTQSASILSLGIVIATITFVSTGQAQQNQFGEPQSYPESPIRIEKGEDGFEWCVIGDPGNIEFPGNWRHGAFEGYGSVPYVYRLTRTEVSIGDYIEFLTAFAPFFDGDPSDIQFTGLFIYAYWEDEQWKFGTGPGYEVIPAPMSVRNAARYCNWLHNGKLEEEWAFLGGAYDATTFTRNPDGTFNDDYTILPGARYWIPTVDEWLKAVYYDPNYGGEGVPGWWRYTHSSDNLIERRGIPYFIGGWEDAPQTNAGIGGPFGRGAALASGMFPRTQTPWGLLDVSGGVEEMALPFSWSSSFWSWSQASEEAGQAARYIVDIPHKGTLSYGSRIASWCTNANGVRR